MLLRYSLGLDKPAKAIEDAVQKVLDGKELGGQGLRTADLKGTVSTKEIGEAIVNVLQSSL